MRNEIKPNGTTQQEEVQAEKLLIFKGGGQADKEPQMNQYLEQEHMKTTTTAKEKQSQMQPLEVEPQIKSVEEEIKST